MAKRYGITVVTSSMFDNENVIIGVVVRFNDRYGALIHIKQNSEVFSNEYNNKIASLVEVFSKNRSIADVIKVIKLQSGKKSWALFDKPLMITNDRIKKEALVEYIERTVFKTNPNVSVIYSTEVISTLPVPEAPKGPSVEVVAPAVVEEKEEEISKENKDLFDKLDAIPDAPDGDYDEDESDINPEELIKLQDDDEDEDEE